MYRPNVCAVIIDNQSKNLLMFHRIGIEKAGWQFPQGGIDEGETENEALFRELEEEIGTREISIIKTSKNLIYYDFPSWVLEKMKSQGISNKFKGQAQRWYLLKLRGGVDLIRFDHQPQEFDKFEWVSKQDTLNRIISFKRPAYKVGLKELGQL